MSFLNDNERKDVKPAFFKWQNGKTYHLTVRKGWEEGFGNAAGYPLFCKNLDNGDSFELKYQWNLMNAIDELGEAYDEGCGLTVVPQFLGMKKSKDGTKEYEQWMFSVELYEGESNASIAAEDELNAKKDGASEPNW